MIAVRLCGLVLVLVASHSSAAEREAEPLFSSNDTVEVLFSAPWREVERARKATTWPATITWTDAGGQQQTLELTVERRGKSRLESCSFPPIRMRFDKRVKDEGLFHNQKSLKLVSHCKKGERWQQYYILEMLAYRIYNLITDYSFRVRSLDVTYIDSEEDKDPLQRFAFVIEDDDAVAKRKGLEKLEIKSTRPNRLDALEASRLALFQMMIGNLDWSAIAGPDDTCCHNVKLIGNDPQNGPIMALPYDFDSSGLIDAPYAEPSDMLPVRSVRDRLYRGYCAHNGTLNEARSQLQSLRGQVVALFEDEVRLEERTRNKALKYIDSFYDILDSDSEFREEILDACRG